MTKCKQTDFDLVVVGASFAGLTCARAAALRGLKVLVLEAKSDPGARVHTTGILVKEAADEIDAPSYLTRPVHGVRLYAPDLTHIDLFSPGYYFLTTSTAGLLRWLAREAERAGARITCDTRFRSAQQLDGRFRFEGLDITCRYLVGADGARSRVADSFGLGTNRRFLAGVEAEVRPTSGIDDRFLHCFLGSSFAPGYIGWAAPSPDALQVGLACNDTAKPDLARFRRHLRPVFDFHDDDIVERRSGVIPCSGLVEPFAAPGVMLVGDAAGMVSPLTAGGIQLAFRHGRRAGQLVADHLLHMGPAPEFVLRGELPNFFLKSALRRLLDAGPPDAVINAILNTAMMRQLAQRVYFHRRCRDGVPFESYTAALQHLDLTAPNEKRPG